MKKFFLLLLLITPFFLFGQGGFPEKPVLDGTEKIRLFAEPGGNKYITPLGIGTYVLDSLGGNGLFSASNEADSFRVSQAYINLPFTRWTATEGPKDWLIDSLLNFTVFSPHPPNFSRINSGIRLTREYGDHEIFIRSNASGDNEAIDYRAQEHIFEVDDFIVIKPKSTFVTGPESWFLPIGSPFFYGLPVGDYVMCVNELGSFPGGIPWVAKSTLTGGGGGSDLDSLVTHTTSGSLLVSTLQSGQEVTVDLTPVVTGLDTYLAIADQSQTDVSRFYTINAGQTLNFSGPGSINSVLGGTLSLSTALGMNLNSGTGLYNLITDFAVTNSTSPHIVTRNPFTGALESRLVGGLINFFDDPNGGVDIVESPPGTYEVKLDILETPTLAVPQEIDWIYIHETTDAVNSPKKATLESIFAQPSLRECNLTLTVTEAQISISDRCGTLNAFQTDGSPTNELIDTVFFINDTLHIIEDGIEHLTHIPVGQRISVDSLAITTQNGSNANPFSHHTEYWIEGNWVYVEGSFNTAFDFVDRHARYTLALPVTPVNPFTFALDLTGVASSYREGQSAGDPTGAGGSVSPPDSLLPQAQINVLLYGGGTTDLGFIYYKYQYKLDPSL